MLVYLSGPIGDRSIEEANAWRQEVTQWLKFLDCFACNPLCGRMEALRSSYTPTEIVTRDKKDIRDSDVILVYWPEKCVSNGTAMEIIFAYQFGKPIVFVGEWAKNDYWINYHATKIVSALEEAYDAILSFS
jgi:nucleoside 2-deoxyribosyltransferase